MAAFASTLKKWPSKRPSVEQYAAAMRSACLGMPSVPKLHHTRHPAHKAPRARALADRSHDSYDICFCGAWLNGARLRCNLCKRKSSNDGANTHHPKTTPNPLPPNTITHPPTPPIDPQTHRPVTTHLPLPQQHTTHKHHRTPPHNKTPQPRDSPPNAPHRDPFRSPLPP